jgi:hypothetical protein
VAIGPDRVQVIKRESSALGGDGADDVDYFEPISAQEDAIECAGIYLQDGSNRDETVYVERNGTSLRFVDGANPGGFSLSQLASGGTGISYSEFLLENDPTAETGATDCTYTPTYSGINITKEEWKRNDTTLVKSIDYTYTGINVTSEVRKVFASDGTTIVAQVTWTYSYTGINLTGATMIRNV